MSAACKCSSMSVGNFNFDLEANPPPLKISSSLGPSSNFSALNLNPRSPFESDVSDSSPADGVSGGPLAYKPVLLAVVILNPVYAQIEGSKTALRLSLPGSDFGEASNDGSGSLVSQTQKEQALPASLEPEKVFGPNPILASSKVFFFLFLIQASKLDLPTGGSTTACQ